MIKLNSKEKQIWFTSDTHYWHKNMTYGESVWANKETGCRRFDTTQEMSRHIVSQINKYVDSEAMLFHLGDWSFGGMNNIWNFREQLNVKEIHLVLGNHDTHIENNKRLSNSPFNAQDLFTSTQQYLEISIDGRMLCLMHYPIEVWNDRHHDSWMLHGHSHGNCPIKEKRLDVGMDNIFKLTGEYKPISWEELKKILST